MLLKKEGEEKIKSVFFSFFKVGLGMIIYVSEELKLSLSLMSK